MSKKPPMLDTHTPPARTRICHPSQIEELTRRQIIQGGTYLTGMAVASQLFRPSILSAQVIENTVPLRRLVWINMGGGWDILESVDPKPASTPGIDMTYSYGLAHNLAGSTSDQKIGRWLSRLASQHGSEMVVVRGLNMGTTSHMAGSVYMDTGVLSNSGNVNSASIPSIVASESSATIPIIQLNGGSDALIDRGLLNPISVVRAQNLDLYRGMYPADDNELQQKLLILNHLEASINRAKTKLGISDRLAAIETAQQKIRIQFQENVGAKLSLNDQDRAAFNVGAPANVNNGQKDSFALALKLLKNNLVTCLNLGIGGFDTHSNQERSLQPTMEGFDYLLSTFITELKAANQLDSTLIVVYSDFGRTPVVNNSNGRDHWPYGGAMMLGGGILGGRFVGATDDSLRNVNINAETGLVDTNGINLNPTHLGGAVLALTLGEAYRLEYRSYLEAIPALVQVKA